MNIILIVSDTFRRDHLGCYGNAWIRTPYLDRLAQQSIVIERCYAASFPTVPNRSDLLTGKYNFTYLGWRPLPQDEITLSQLLTSEGYVTAGIVDTPFYLRDGYGYDRGFLDFVWLRDQRSGKARNDVVYARRYEEDHFAATTMSVAEKWLELHRKDKFFLLVDTWDPHEPWDPPAHYVELYLDDYDGQPAPWPSYWYWKEAGLSEEDVKRAHAHYCAEITMVDRAIGRLLERIDSLGLIEDTAIIFTSDHGFYFGEHGIFGKGLYRSQHGFRVGPEITERGTLEFTFRCPETGRLTVGNAQWYRSPLYEEVTRIPLIIHLPQAEAKRIDALVSPPDLMPTILELAGVEVPETVQGHSLVPLLRDEHTKVHDFVVTSWPLHEEGAILKVVDDVGRSTTEVLPSTITNGEWTLLCSVQGQPVELYHTATDPEQRRNVFEGNEGVARKLHSEFVGFLEELGTADELLAQRRRLF